jgi:hypothetical protein
MTGYALFGSVGSITSTGLNGMAIGATTASTGAFTTLSASSTVSGTGITNLFASPPAIGATAPNTGNFTTLAASQTISISSSYTHNPLTVNTLTGGFGQIGVANTGKTSVFGWLGISGGTGEILTGDAVGDFDIYSGQKINFSANGSSIGASLTSTGFSVTGTSTLTGNVTVGAASTAASATIGQGGTGSFNTFLSVNGTAAGTSGFGPYINFNTNSVGQGQIGVQNGIIGGATNNITLSALNALTFYTNNGSLALTLDTSQNATFAGTISMPKTITAPGTTGAQTINKASGTVRFAASAGSLVVTDSVVTANSIITGNLITNDATAILGAIVPASGSFTIYMKTNPTAETGVCFSVTN